MIVLLTTIYYLTTASTLAVMFSYKATSDPLTVVIITVIESNQYSTLSYFNMMDLVSLHYNHSVCSGKYKHRNVKREINPLLIKLKTIHL